MDDESAVVFEQSPAGMRGCHPGVSRHLKEDRLWTLPRLKLNFVLPI